MRNLFFGMLLLSFGAWADNEAVSTTTSEEEVQIEQPAIMDPYKAWMGVQTGMAISNASLEALPTTQRVGFSVGAFYEAPLLPGFLYLQPEISFVQKGAYNTFFGADSARFNYIEVPLLAKVKFILPRIRPFALAGVGLGYMVGASNSAGTAMTGLNPFEISLILGGGLAFELGEGPDSTQLNFSARFSRSLNRLDSKPGNSGWTSNVFSLLVGIQV